MSEHRRKPPQSRGRRASGSSGRRAAPPPVPPAGPDDATGAMPERPYGSRAEARRASQRGGSRRRAASASEGAGGRATRRRGETAPGKKRFIDYPRSGYRGLRRWVPSWRQVLGSSLAFLAMMIGLVGVAYAMTEIPGENEIAIQESNVYYWENGDRMVVSGESNVNRQNLDLADMPLAMQDSVISAENASFYSDPGIDIMGIGRAVLNMARGGETQSGSTITQQYVKNMYLTQDQTLERKARELLLSVKVGAEIDKDDILQGYLNTSDFGRGALGLQAAAQAYYGVDAIELTDSQCAFLTSLLKGPALYDPYIGGEGGAADDINEENLARAEERWSWVLDRRVEVGDLSAEDRQAIADEPFPMPTEPTPAMEQAGQIGYLTTLANRFIVSQGWATEEELAQGGFQIHTTFNKTMMDQMESSVDAVVEENIDPEERPEDRHVQFGGASVVPGDGAIRAIYGGEDFTEHFTNNADNPGVQVGSTFKPFVLAAAMDVGIRDPDGDADQGPDERTRLSPESVYHSENGQLIENYQGDPVTVEDAETGEEIEWHQNNFLEKDHGDITLREAMEVSANVPWVQVGMDVGPETVAEAAVAAGLHPESLVEANDTVPTFALGVSTPGPIRMASAYATFAASGEQADPYSVTSIEGGPDNISETFEVETVQAFESDVADNVTDVLTGVIEGDEGSGRDAQVLDRPVAGKTGTTDDNRSAWFVGYSPQLSTAIGMWRMADSEDELEGDEEMGQLSMYGTAGSDRINGSSLPLEIWIAFMREALKDEPKEEFPTPSEIGEIEWGGGAESPRAPPPAEETDEPEPPETDDPTDDPTDPTDPPTDDPTDPEDPCDPLDPFCDPGGQDGGADTGQEGGAEEGQEGGQDGGADAGQDGGAEEGQDGGESTDSGGGWPLGGGG
ncbi:transglycosylase domain-containing protein [Streptomyces sp. SBT349]|uniref:transglycosylase domain-containing protein n=1 Tax=Streptomyces sp. SBT349 TaxID=1580539 RepID=UPI00066D4DC5|nr:transglycosylase domain-containing protein [Streptomyces sp. SBT349]